MITLGDLYGCKHKETVVINGRIICVKCKEDLGGQGTK